MRHAKKSEFFNYVYCFVHPAAYAYRRWRQAGDQGQSMRKLYKMRSIRKQQISCVDPYQ